MYGGRLNDEELQIIERTKEEGRELHAGNGLENADSGKPRKNIRHIASFYIWLVVIFLLIATGISLMLWLLPGTGS